MSMNDADVQTVVERYTRRFVEFGYDPRTLGWDKGKQMLRFGVLTSQIELRGKRILDIGCGFGDLNKLLCERCGDEYRYLGVDLGGRQASWWYVHSSHHYHYIRYCGWPRWRQDAGLCWQHAHRPGLGLCSGHGCYP